MNEVYEYDCRESAEAALDRIGEATQVAVWSTGNLEDRLAKLHKETTTLKVILGAWRLAEEQRKAAEKRTDAEVKAEHPIAWMASVQQQQFSPILEETTKQKGDTNER